MPSLGPTELIIILVLALIVFGAGKLSDVGGALGKSIREFRRTSGEDEPKTTPSEGTQEPPKASQEPPKAS